MVSFLMKGGLKMAPKKNSVRTLSIREIEKSPVLALGISQNDIRKYEKVASLYGNVSPVVVGVSEKGYRVLSGQVLLEACAKAGVKETPVVVAGVEEEAEQMKLSLLLSVTREEGGALSEGEQIHRLLNKHGVKREELRKLLGKSQAWLSKRQAMVNNLTEPVKAMVRQGVLYTRTAEEIAKLPPEVQGEFATHVAGDGLSKSETEMLVRMYRGANVSQACQEAIIQSPSMALATSAAGRRHPPRKEKRSLTGQIAAAASFGLNLAGEIRYRVAEADAETLRAAADHLSSLSAAMAELSRFLYAVLESVSPGKHSEDKNASTDIHDTDRDAAWS
jgi:ParB-like chromosome segregation protein Spo0J